jgi:hypothetical protein
MNWKTIFLSFLILSHIGILVWLGYSTWTGSLPWYVGLLGFVGMLMLMRNYVRVYQQYPPLVDGPAPPDGVRRFRAAGGADPDVFRKGQRTVAKENMAGLRGARPRYLKAQPTWSSACATVEGNSSCTAHEALYKSW